MKPGSHSPPSLIVVFLCTFILLQAVSAQDWFPYPGFFLDSFATQGPPAAWDQSQYDAQGPLINANTQNGYIPSQHQQGVNIQNSHGSAPQNMGQIGLGNPNQSPVPAAHQGGLFQPQSQYPQQWQVDPRMNQNPVISGNPEGLVLTQSGDSHASTPTVFPTSPTPDPTNTSAGPSQDQWSTNGQTFDQQLSPAVDQHAWQDPGPPPLDKLQSNVDANAHLTPVTDQLNLNPSQQAVDLQQGQQTPSLFNTSHTNTQGHIHSSAVQHYIMPPGGSYNLNAWPAMPKGEIPMRPEAKADWIRYMREAAMRFYGQYPNYPQPTWKNIRQHPSIDKQSPAKSKIWVNGEAATKTKESTMSGDNSQAAKPIVSDLTVAMPVQHPAQSGSKKEQLDVPVQNASVLNPSTGIKRNITLASGVISNSLNQSNGENTVTRSTPPKQGTSSSETGDHLLTPHKNMTNAELHKIIRILLIPHKTKRLAKPKPVMSHQPSTGSTQHQATITSIRRPSQPGMNHQRRPISEMHIKMVNYAPHPPRPFIAGMPGLSTTSTHPSLSHPHKQSLSEIHVKLINYDQNIVDTFNSQVSPPRSRLTQPRWVSAKVHPSASASASASPNVTLSPSPNASQHVSANQRARQDDSPSASPSLIKYPTPPKRSHIKTVTNSTKNNITLQTASHGKPKVSSSPGNVLQKQGAVKNHQKAVVRHTQMLHHVMGSLAREMNRFQGSVRQSRTYVPSNTNPVIPKSIQRAANSANFSASTKSSNTKATESTLVSLGSGFAFGTQNKTKVTVPLALRKDTSGEKTTVANNWNINTNSILSSISNRDLSVHGPSNININTGVTAATTPYQASPPTTDINQGSTTTPPAPTALTPSNSGANKQQQHITGITELKIADISPSSLTSEHGTKKAQESNLMSHKTPYVFSNSGHPDIQVSAFYPHLNGTSKTSSISQKHVAEGGEILAPDTQTTPVGVLYDQSTIATTSQPVPESFATDLSPTTGAYPGMNPEVLDQQLSKQLGKLEQLHHKQQIVEKKQQLKDQHDRLKKQRDFLQQQLATLRKLRGADPGTALPEGLSNPPLAIPENPAGLAALLSGLQMNFPI